MGLQGQLSDVSSDSIPLMLVALLATLFKHVRSFFLRFSSSSSVVEDASLSISSGFANIAVLADQLKLNRLFSYPYDHKAAAAASDCIVCLSTLKTGEEVRKLGCRHVFHKQCLEGWLQHLNFNCPLCRSPLVGRGGGCESITSSFSLLSDAQ
uniref:RING finger protein n=1 Tax=Raphanus sativus TaxID=3726 RepID=A0A0N9WV24_RAPSA|nr:RING finger protein [Raphanus sativus]